MRDSSRGRTFILKIWCLSNYIDFLYETIERSPYTQKWGAGRGPSIPRAPPYLLWGAGGHRNILLGCPEMRQRNEVSELRARPVLLISPRPRSGSSGERLPKQNRQKNSQPIYSREIIMHHCKPGSRLPLISRSEWLVRSVRSSVTRGKSMIRAFLSAEDLIMRKYYVCKDPRRNLEWLQLASHYKWKS